MQNAPKAPSIGKSRRSFLRKGIFGGLVLAVGGAGFLASRRSRVLDLPAQGLLVLDLTEYAVLMSVAARVLPEGEGFRSVSEVAAGVNADRILALADPTAAKELKQLLRLFENALAGFIFDRRIRPFTTLSISEQDQVLRDWQSSRLQIRRTGFQALRTLVIASYFSSPLTWPTVQYPGPPPGFHQPDAPVWRGGGEKRPDGNGVFHPPSRRD